MTHPFPGPLNGNLTPRPILGRCDHPRPAPLEGPDRNCPRIPIPAIPDGDQCLGRSHGPRATASGADQPCPRNS